MHRNTNLVNETMIDNFIQLYIDFFLNLTTFGKALIASVTILLILGILSLVLNLIKRIVLALIYLFLITTNAIATFFYSIYSAIRKRL